MSSSRLSDSYIIETKLQNQGARGIGPPSPVAQQEHLQILVNVAVVYLDKSHQIFGIELTYVNSGPRYAVLLLELYY